MHTPTYHPEMLSDLRRGASLDACVHRMLTPALGAHWTADATLAAPPLLGGAGCPAPTAVLTSEDAPGLRVCVAMALEAELTAAVTAADTPQALDLALSAHHAAVVLAADRQPERRDLLAHVYYPRQRRVCFGRWYHAARKGWRPTLHRRSSHFAYDVFGGNGRWVSLRGQLTPNCRSESCHSVPASYTRTGVVESSARGQLARWRIWATPQEGGLVACLPPAGPELAVGPGRHAPGGTVGVQLAGPVLEVHRGYERFVVRLLPAPDGALRAVAAERAGAAWRAALHALEPRQDVATELARSGLAEAPGELLRLRLRLLLLECPAAAAPGAQKTAPAGRPPPSGLTLLLWRPPAEAAQLGLRALAQDATGSWDEVAARALPEDAGLPAEARDLLRSPPHPDETGWLLRLAAWAGRARDLPVCVSAWRGTVLALVHGYLAARAAATEAAAAEAMAAGPPTGFSLFAAFSGRQLPAAPPFMREGQHMHLSRDYGGLRRGARVAVAEAPAGLAAAKRALYDELHARLPSPEHGGDADYRAAAAAPFVAAWCGAHADAVVSAKELAKVVGELARRHAPTAGCAIATHERRIAELAGGLRGPLTVRGVLDRLTELSPLYARVTDAAGGAHVVHLLALQPDDPGPPPPEYGQLALVPMATGGVWALARVLGGEADAVVCRLEATGCVLPGLPQARLRWPVASPGLRLPPVCPAAECAAAMREMYSGGLRCGKAARQPSVGGDSSPLPPDNHQQPGQGYGQGPRAAGEQRGQKGN